MLRMAATTADVLQGIEVVIEVTPATYEEIRQKLIRRGAGGQFTDHPLGGGELIELSGVAITLPRRKRRSQPQASKNRKEDHAHVQDRVVR